MSRALIVDSDGKLGRRMMRKYPYRFTYATTIEQASALARRDNPDVIVLDHQWIGHFQVFKRLCPTAQFIFIGPDNAFAALQAALFEFQAFGCVTYTPGDDGHVLQATVKVAERVAHEESGRALELTGGDMAEIRDGRVPATFRPWTLLPVEVAMNHEHPAYDRQLERRARA